jgi:hypothetical protein
MRRRSWVLLHIRMMPGKRSKGNYDPSRARGLLVGAAAADTHAAGPDDRVVPRGSAGADDWHIVAGGAWLDGGRPGCNSVAHGHSASRERIWRGIRYPGKPAAGAPLRREPPCAFAGGARQRQQLRGNLEPASMWCPNQGSPYRNPVASNDGVPFLLPAFEPKYTFNRTADDWTDDLRLRRR